MALHFLSGKQSYISFFDQNCVFLAKTCRITNAKLPIKGSKNLYHSLVFTKNSCQKIGSWCSRPGLDDLGQKSVNLTQLWRHRQKNKIQTF